MKDQDKINALIQIIEEGNAIETLNQSPTGEIIRRTLQAQLLNYEGECFDAAKDTTKNVANFLGRMEAIKWVLQTLAETFTQAKNAAIVEKNTLEAEAKEQEELDAGVSREHNVPMQHKPGTI